MLRPFDNKIVQINGELFNFAFTGNFTKCVICNINNKRIKVYRPLYKLILISLVIRDLGTITNNPIRICDHCLDELENNYVEFKFKCQHGLN